MTSDTGGGYAVTRACRHTPSRVDVRYFNWVRCAPFDAVIASCSVIACGDGLHMLFRSPEPPASNPQALTRIMDSKEFAKYGGLQRTSAAFASTVEKEATATGKALRTISGKKLTTTPLAIDGDSPGVTVFGSATSYMSMSRMAIGFQFDRMETLVRLGMMTGKEARQFLRYAEFEPLEASLEAIRDHVSSTSKR